MIKTIKSIKENKYKKENIGIFTFFLVIISSLFIMIYSIIKFNMINTTSILACTTLYIMILILSLVSYYDYTKKLDNECDKSIRNNRMLRQELSNKIFL